METRLILARLVWNFDVDLMPESVEWAKQKVYLLYEKVPLKTRLTARPERPRGGRGLRGEQALHQLRGPAGCQNLWYGIHHAFEFWSWQWSPPRRTGLSVTVFGLGRL